MAPLIKQILLSIITVLLVSISLEAASEKKVIYVMDPQCGWCYANNKNMKVIYDAYGKKVEFELLTGGMWVGDKAPKGSAKLLKFIKAHTPKIVSKTGATFDKSYYDLAKDENYTFSSLEPSAAIVLIKEIKPEVVFKFTKMLQNALYLEGKQLDKYQTYDPILSTGHL